MVAHFGAILPVEHLRFRILEEVSEFLFDIGSSEETATTIKTLALDYTRNLTGVELLTFAKEVLPTHCARKVEGYIALEFPLLLHPDGAIACWRNPLTESSVPRSGLNMRGKYIVGLVPSLFIWIWAHEAPPTKSDLLEWPGLESDWTAWSPNKLPTPCDPNCRAGNRIWTESHLLGCLWYGNILDRTMNTTTLTGQGYPQRRKSLLCPMVSNYFSGSSMSNAMQKVRTIFCTPASPPYLDSTASCNLYIDLCCRSRDRLFCFLPSKAEHSPARMILLDMPALRGKRDSERIGHLFERPRGHLRFKLAQSSPSPESGDKGEDSSSALNQLSFVDVRVRGTGGQQPLGAEPGRFQRPQFDANLFDHTLQFGDLKGIYMHVSCSPLQSLEFLRLHSDRLGNPRPCPTPPAVLAGTVALLLVFLTLSPGPKPSNSWQATRILEGIYRRRPVIMHARLPLSTLPTVQRVAHRSGPQKCSGRVAFLLATAMLMHTASAAPTPHSGPSALHTPHLVGVTNLCSRKHSFRRAQRQALDTGSAIYRGRCMSAKQLGVEWKPVKPVRSRAPAKADNCHRIRVITWNSGGLNLARQAEVRTWLLEESQTNPIHVLCIQETHWPMSCEYQDGPWTCIHSGYREGGALIMLNTQYFSGTDIKHAEIHPGRLLHVRICSNPAIDLLCVYQHAWNPAKSEFQHRSVPAEQLLINKRQEVWQSVQGWIAGVLRGSC